MTTRFVLVAAITYIWIALLRESGSTEMVPVPLGCIGTSDGDPAMPTMMMEDKMNMNQELCIDYCSLNEMTFAGVQVGTKCWCTRAYPRFGKTNEQNCRTVCAGNSVEYCGGPGGITAFAVCDEGHYGPKCDLPCMCFEKAVCDFMTGKCLNGKCEAGWKGERCDIVIPKQKSSYQQTLMKYVDIIVALGTKIKSYFVLTEDPPEECNAGSYGILCKEFCHCASGTKCDRMTGVCSSGPCAFGWLGMRCDKPHPCAVNPCENNGRCILDGFRMHCECSAGYSGTNCDLADPCFRNPCQNYGRCLANKVEFKCDCQGDFSGLRCEISVASMPNEPVYLGCFREYDKEPEFDKNINLHLVTPKACTLRCKAKLYTYAGLQDGKKCKCSKSYAQYGAASEKDCSAPCSGDNSIKCGGANLNSVYAVCGVGKYRLDCKGACNCFGAQCDVDSGICPNPFCNIGYFGEKCDQARVETANTYKNSRQYIAYGLGVFAGFTFLQVACLALKSMFAKSAKQEPKTTDKEQKGNDVESQKKELDALLGESSEKKPATKTNGKEEKENDVESQKKKKPASKAKTSKSSSS